MQDLETHLLNNHPKREVKSTDLTMTMVTTLKRENDATKRKMCGKNNITSRHYIKYLHSRIYPIMYGFISPWNYVLSRQAIRLQKVFTNRPTGYLQVYKATLTTAISLTIKNNWKICHQTLRIYLNVRCKTKLSQIIPVEEKVTTTRQFSTNSKISWVTNCY